MTFAEIFAGLLIGAAFRRVDDRNDPRNDATQRIQALVSANAVEAEIVVDNVAPAQQPINDARPAKVAHGDGWAAVELGGSRDPASVTTAAEAVENFVELYVIALHAAGLRNNPQRWRTVASNYRWHVDNDGWPAMSDRALSMALVANGCRRISPKGEGGPYPAKRFPCRSVLIVFPTEKYFKRGRK